MDTLYNNHVHPLKKNSQCSVRKTDRFILTFELSYHVFHVSFNVHSDLVCSSLVGKPYMSPIYGEIIL